MAKNGFKIIDSDMHIMEPPDLWEKYIDSRFKARAPRGAERIEVMVPVRRPYRAGSRASEGAAARRDY